MGSLLTAVTLLCVAADGGVAAPRPLRALVLPVDEDILPGDEDPAVHERALLEDFARAQGRPLELVPVERIADLEPALAEKRGDLIGVGLVVTKARSERLAFTRPVRAVDEWLVGRRGAKDAPRSPAALAGRTVAVPVGSSYAETVEALATTVPGLVVDTVHDVVGADALAQAVARGERPLTVVDDNRLEAMRRYVPDLEPLFVLAKDRPVAFAMRKGDAALRAQFDAFLVARALSPRHEPSTADLDAIKKRGTLRLLTQNNSVSFFLQNGSRRGFDYELIRSFASGLGLHVEVVVAPTHDALIPMLREGKGDVIAAAMTRTPAREQLVAFSRPYLFTRPVLVQRKGGPVKRLEDLAGRRVTVWASSSYAELLPPLAAKYGFTVANAPEDEEVEDLMAEVGDGTLELTVADSHALAAESLLRDDLEAALELSATDDELAFAVRKENPQLLKALDAFVRRVYRGTEYNLLKRRSFENTRAVAAAKSQDSGRTGRLSPYDAIIKKYSQRYGFDWRLMTAQAWRESHFDPKARSPVGALGLFQVMPATGRELGFTKLTDADEGTHAGIKYLSRLVARVEATVPLEERVRFALAAYNAGFRRLEDARRLAKELGLDPNVWSGNVEKAMGLLSRPKYAKRTGTGFCRCQEPVAYVGIIESKYRSYAQLVPP